MSNAVGLFYRYDTSTTHHYLPVMSYKDGTELCRCKEDGFYYLLTDTDRKAMHIRFGEQQDMEREAIAYLEDKEQCRIGYLLKGESKQ